MVDLKKINMIDEEKVFFQAGDVVTIKQNIRNKPEMIIV